MVGAEWKVVTGGGGAAFVDARAVIARGEEACSREEDSEVVGSDVPGGCVRTVGLSPFSRLGMDPEKDLGFEFELL